MNNNVANVDQNPAAVGFSLNLAVNFVFVTNFVFYSVGNAVKHAVACSGADDEIVGEIDLIADVQQNDVLGFMVFQNFNDISC